MNGLDKIINSIALDAEGEAKRITAEAKAEAERIVSRARVAAAKTEQDGKTEAEAECNRIITRAESADEVAAARIMLREKQQTVSEVIDSVKAELASMDTERYFEYMERLLSRYAENEQGQIILSETDKKRMPERFGVLLNEKKLSVSDKTADAEAGFILVYGDIEENCTIDALLASEHDRLHDAVSRFLFGEV